MSTELPIEEAGYVDIRDHMEATWIYHALYDVVGGNEYYRKSIADANTTWAHDTADPLVKTLILETLITGQALADANGVTVNPDGSLATPITIGHSQIYKVASAGTPLAKNDVTSFTFEQFDDQMRVQHYINVPQQV